MKDKGQPQPKVINEGVKPALAPVDGRPPSVSPVPDGKAGKPALAPVDVAPPSPPAPSQPAPSEPSGGQD